MVDPKILFPFSQNSNYSNIRSIQEYTKFGFISNDKDILDLSLGNCGCFMLGFDRTDFIEYVSQKMLKNPFVGGEFMTTNKDVISLSNKLYNITGGYRSVYSLSGSDAVEGAIKIARLTHLSQGNDDKKIVLGFENSYHGSTYMSSSISGSSMMIKYLGRSALCKSLDNSSEEESLISIKNNIENIQAKNISCIVIETCSWLNGLKNHSQFFWKTLKDICSEYNILLIIDDIAMCGGKTGKFVGFNIEPDIFTMGKALSGGYFPLSSCMVSDKIYHLIKKEFLLHGFTYSFSMSGIYSTLKYLEILEEEKILDRYDIVKTSSNKIFDVLVSKNLIKRYNDYGLCYNLEFLNSKSTNDFTEQILYDCGINAGIWNHEGNGLLCFVPLTADDNYFINLLNRLEQSLSIL